MEALERLEEKQAILRELSRRRARRKIDLLFPDDGPLRREFYPQHIAFLAAGAIHRERLFLAANRVGKTELGAYETTCHLTGQYPKWWQGRVFSRSINAWAAGKDSKTTRDILQFKLIGGPGELGTGMLPGDAIISTTPKPGVPEGIESVTVRHVSGGKSRLVLKSYDQGRESFQGTEQHVVWLDEECDREIFIECLTRTLTTDGLVMLTFTPLNGMTDIVRDFLGYNPDSN